MNTIVRCPWPGTDPLMIKYHDDEWGVPLHDEHRHFEFLLLECFQAGLSWSIILRKRKNMKKAFSNFNAVKIAHYYEKKTATLLQDHGIIRNRLKISAAINNAQKFLEIQQKYNTFDEYIWHFTDGKPIINTWKSHSTIPVVTKLSDIISKDLRQNGFKFVGSTTIYAHLQAIGIVNDHLISCFRHKECQSASSR